MNHRYPGTSFSDHIFRYHDNPDVKMIVLLGEVRMLLWIQEGVRTKRFCPVVEMYTVFNL